jgi:branched-chain amino acid transport system substrate-binding protein
MATDAAPLLIGVLHDHSLPDQDASFERSASVGIALVGERLDRPIEFRHVHAAGLPRGSANAVVTAFEHLVSTGVLAVIGPAITDNGLVVRDLADAAEIPCINYTGSEQTRSQWMFQYQIGSLEEEPNVLARHLSGRGLTRIALVYDRSTIGSRYASFFEDACPAFGVELAGRIGVSPVTEDLGAAVESLRATGADALIYLGLGLSAYPLARALAASGWSPPVVANSALMFGYANADWAKAWNGWTYCDSVSGGNEVLAALQQALGAAMPGPGPPGQHDLGRLVAEAAARADQLTRAGLREGLERIKMLPSATGCAGTTMGFGQWDRAALKGEYLVLRRWDDGISRELPDV